MTSDGVTVAGATSRAASYANLPEERARYWGRFGKWGQTYFPNVVGLELEEVKVDYARLRLPYRPELRQPAGVVHGGAIATLIDTVVVPAIGAYYPEMPMMLTVDMQVRYLGAARETDLVAEGWVTKRGRSIVFCQAEVLSAPGGDAVAEGWLTYRVRT
ncbi:MAG TPA: PaaI family thioesterase [Acidimicrobiales bacterium]